MPTASYGLNLQVRRKVMLMEIQGGVVSPRRQSLNRRTRPYITNEDSLISGDEDFGGQGDTKELVQP